jgi:hypothetical protein
MNSKGFGTKSPWLNPYTLPVLAKGYDDDDDDDDDDDNNNNNSMALVCERTIPTERPPLVGEVSYSQNKHFFGRNSSQLPLEYEYRALLLCKSLAPSTLYTSVVG